MSNIPYYLAIGVGGELILHLFFPAFAKRFGNFALGICALPIMLIVTILTIPYLAFIFFEEIGRRFRGRFL